MKRTRLLLIALIAPLALLLPACESTQRNDASATPHTSDAHEADDERHDAHAKRHDDEGHAEADEGVASAGDEDELSEAELEALRLKLEKAEVALRVAELKAERPNGSNAQRMAAAERKLVAARRAVRLAEGRLEHRREHDHPHRLARSELDIARAQDRVWAERQELEQLEAMYAEEQIADKAREIVLDRAQRRLARAERDLELLEEERATLEDVELRIELFELETELVAKQHDREEAERDLELARLDAETAELEARAAIMGAEAEVQEIRAKLEAHAAAGAKLEAIVRGDTGARGE